MPAIVFNIMALLSKLQMVQNPVEGIFEYFLFWGTVTCITYIVMFVGGIWLLVGLAYCIIRSLVVIFTRPPPTEQPDIYSPDEQTRNNPNYECPACRCWDALEANGLCRYCNIEKVL